LGTSRVVSFLGIHKSDVRYSADGKWGGGGYKNKNKNKNHIFSKETKLSGY
jgi:hypothetical protein